jgi:Tfp pilus assembly protein PilF
MIMLNNSPAGCRIRSIIFVLISGSFLAACQSLPLTDTAADDTAKTLYIQANESLKAGETDLAIQQFEQLLEIDPSAKHAYTNLGLLYMHKENSQSAKQAFLNAIERDKNDAVAYNHLAVIQRQQGMFQQALSNYKNAIDADPEYANAHLNLGILLDIYLQELPEALEQYKQYQRLTDNSNKDVDKWLADIKRRIDQQKNHEKERAQNDI